MTVAPELTPPDVDRLARFGIDADLLKRSLIRRVDDRDARELLSMNGKAGNFAGLEYPYFDPRTGHRVTSQIRLDHPPLKADGTPEGKYRSPFGDRRHLYFPPGVAALLADTSVPVVVAEAVTSALAITAAATRADRRVLALACGGCWGWSGRIGKTEDHTGARVDVKGALPDFSLVTWTTRPTVILFDARPNDSVRAARRALARELRHRGAVARHGHLPDDDHRVNGPDDLVAVHGDAALWRGTRRRRHGGFCQTSENAGGDWRVPRQPAAGARPFGDDDHL